MQTDLSIDTNRFPELAEYSGLINQILSEEGPRTAFQEKHDMSVFFSKQQDALKAEEEEEVFYDKLFALERRRACIQEETKEAVAKKVEMRQRARELELQLAGMLKTREYALSDKFRLEQKLHEIQNSKTHRTKSASNAKKKQLADLEVSLASAKLALVEIKERLERRRMEYRDLEKEFVTQKLDLAQRQASTEDFRISLEYATREKSALADQARQMQHYVDQQ